jgi:hypothetical protein
MCIGLSWRQSLIAFFLGCLLGLVGCSYQRFSIAVVNGSTREMYGTTVEYANGRAPAGSIGAGFGSVADAPKPTGPIHLAWSEDDGSRYSIDIPIKAGYVIEPEGILVLQVLPERTVSVHGTLQKDCWGPHFYELGVIYRSTKETP